MYEDYFGPVGFLSEEWMANIEAICTSLYRQKYWKFLSCGFNWHKTTDWTETTTIGGLDREKENTFGNSETEDTIALKNDFFRTNAKFTYFW